MGSGAAGFSYIQTNQIFFLITDPILQGRDPLRDAVELASTLLNLCKSDSTSIALAEADEHLGWGPRRLNPAADYLALQNRVQAVAKMGSKPYTYTSAFVNHRTRRFVQSPF